MLLNYLSIWDSALHIESAIFLVDIIMSVIFIAHIRDHILILLLGIICFGNFRKRQTNCTPRLLKILLGEHKKEKKYEENLHVTIIQLLKV